VGIALRKMERYETAEKYYKKALEIGGKDVGLLFNLGRLYVEWQHWRKAERTAQLIVKLDPDFAEGKKLLEYILKMQNNIDNSSEEILSAEAGHSSS
jgi:Tetratricopeptide repeat.